MIRLAELARVRLGRGRRVHAVVPPGSGATACGLHVHLHDPWGRKTATALTADTPVTCTRCAPAERTARP